MTGDFLYSTITFLLDAPLAQMDRALDFGLNIPLRQDPRLLPAESN